MFNCGVEGMTRARQAVVWNTAVVDGFEIYRKRSQFPSRGMVKVVPCMAFNDVTWLEWAIISLASRLFYFVCDCRAVLLQLKSMLLFCIPKAPRIKTNFSSRKPYQRHVKISWLDWTVAFQKIIFSTLLVSLILTKSNGFESPLGHRRKHALLPWIFLYYRNVLSCREIIRISIKYT